MPQPDFENLTHNQREMVDRFVRKTAYDWRSLDSKARSQSLHQLKKIIQDRATEASYDSRTDQTWAEFLKSIQIRPSGWVSIEEPEDAQAPERPLNSAEPDPLPPIEKVPALSQPVENGIVLGVCESWADQLKISANGLRVVVAGLGLITGPFAITAYLLVYGERIANERIDRPTLRHLQPKEWSYCLIAFAVGAATFVFRKISFAFGNALSDSTMFLGEWDWLDHTGATLTFWALFSTATLSALLTLPVSSRARIWAKRVASTVLTAYAIAMSYGMGRLLTGFILRASEY